MEGRLDLRDEITFTIDGADAKDLDDAVTSSFEKWQYRTQVHIMDVSYYVTEGSASTRKPLTATSVYVTDRGPNASRAFVKWHLSLNPRVDRLTSLPLWKLINMVVWLIHHYPNSYQDKFS